MLIAVSYSPQNDDKRAAITALQEDLEDKTLLLNVEYKVNGIPAATLLDASTKDDLVKALVSEGYLLVEKRDRRSSAKLVRI